MKKKSACITFFLLHVPNAHCTQPRRNARDKNVLTTINQTTMELKNENEVAEQPHYYTDGMKKECIEAMEEVFGEEKTGFFCLLNAFKYLWRRDGKYNRTLDTQKARWYIDKYNSITGKHVTMEALLTIIDTYREEE